MSPFANLPRAPYQLALIDPPWAFRTYTGGTRTPSSKRIFAASGAGSHAGAADHYPTMPLADMAALPVSDLMAADSVIAMWLVGSHLGEAAALGQAWGFGEPLTDLFYWVKTKLINAEQIGLFTGDLPEPKISMGYYTRKQAEPCWLFKRGKGLPVKHHGVRQLIIAPPREHSRKPPEQYERLEALFGNVTRVELFSRTQRPGWDAWGNQVGKFEEELA